MAHKEYLDYLESPEWWTIRRTAMRRANWRCEREKPGDPRHEGPLEVHHRTYENLGRERLDDVEVLCPACHRNEHIPRNVKKRQLEAYGQARLFDRWVDERDDWPVPLKAA
jgi:5-methylcytosine-specific restriction endonuclease McrA